MEQTIRHRCGHEQTHHFEDSTEQADRRRMWLRSVPCLACWKAGRRADALMENASAGLPALEGSAAQVQWAESIRADKVKAVYGLWFDRYLSDDRAVADALPDRLNMDEAIACLARPAYASWWIERRGRAIEELVREIMDATPGF